MDKFLRKIQTCSKEDAYRIVASLAGTLLGGLLFYFVLKVFGTARLPLSTLSVTTSFAAVCLTYLRSEYFALAYALNDIVLLGLWIPAAAQEQRYVPTAVCFGIFLGNDLYGFLNWKKMKRRQRQPLPRFMHSY